MTVGSLMRTLRGELAVLGIVVRRDDDLDLAFSTKSSTTSQRKGGDESEQDDWFHSAMMIAALVPDNRNR